MLLVTSSNKYTKYKIHTRFKINIRYVYDRKIANNNNLRYTKFLNLYYLLYYLYLRWLVITKSNNFYLSFAQKSCLICITIVKLSFISLYLNYIYRLSEYFDKFIGIKWRPAR